MDDDVSELRVGQTRIEGQLAVLHQRVDAVEAHAEERYQHLEDVNQERFGSIRDMIANSQAKQEQFMDLQTAAITETRRLVTENANTVATLQTLVKGQATPWWQDISLGKIILAIVGLVGVLATAVVTLATK